MKSTTIAIRRFLVPLLLGVGIFLAVAAAIALLPKQDETVGDAQMSERSLEDDGRVASTVASTLPTEPTEDPRVVTAPGILPNEVSTLDALNSGAGPVPVGLFIRSIDVDAPVIPQGIDAQTGQMEVPNNVSEVAWYEYGPAPGESGSAVLAAHVDLAGEGRGVFFELRQLELGDLVEVTYDNETSEEFRVQARTIYKKDDLPLEDIFSREGPPVLTLITCGGSFNASVRSYDSNVVVYALPVNAIETVSQLS